MNSRLRIPAIAVATLLAGAAHAQANLKPGLWEETITTKTDNAQANAAMEQMKQRLAAMTPDQRAMMEKMMGGHTMPGSGAPNSVRVCVTKEQIARGMHPEGNGRCTRSNVSQSGSVTRFDFSCTSEHSSVTGQGTFTEMGDKAFAVSSTADTVTSHNTMHIQSDVAGKFVSSDCGDVKPFEPPAK